MSFRARRTRRRCWSSSTAATGAHSTSATCRSSRRRSCRTVRWWWCRTTRCAPRVDIETIALQMVDALAWTWRHAALYGGDPERIVVAGHSAGGHLAAMMLCCRWRAVASDLPQRLVRSALADLGPVRPRADTPDAVPEGGPAAHAGAGAQAERRVLPATRGTLYAAVGAHESEEFLRQNELIREAWGAGDRAGVRNDRRDAITSTCCTTSRPRRAGCTRWRCGCSASREGHDRHYPPCRANSRRLSNGLRL